MTITGKIAEVMESWPLQLAVESGAIRYHVGLLDDTTIASSGGKMKPGDLRPDQQVRISGIASQEAKNALTAEIIEILD